MIFFKKYFDYLHFLFRNINKNKQLSIEIRNDMYLIPTLNTQEEVSIILNKIQNCEEPGTEGNYFKFTIV